MARRAKHTVLVLVLLLHCTLTLGQRRAKSKNAPAPPLQHKCPVEGTCDTDCTAPVNEKSPRRCWPRVVVLPSFPTSGNALVQELFEKATGWFSACLEHRICVAQDTVQNSGYTILNVEDLFSVGNASIRYWNRTLPTQDYPPSQAPVGVGSTILKTHFPKHFHYDAIVDTPDIIKDFSEVLEPAGVLYLVRNPGDNLFRDRFRWYGSADAECRTKFKNDMKACWNAHAKDSCGTWNVTNLIKFHKYWLEYNTSVPRKIVQYETLSDPDQAQLVARRMFDFLGETAPRLDFALRSIRKPQYAPGSLVAKICGLEVARELHAATAEISAAIGYGFDHDSATWYVDQSRADLL